MTTEQKAKAYDEALERAKKWYNAPNIDKMPTYGNRIIEEIFPELREGEDERVRKELIEHVKDQQSSFISAPDCRDKYEEEENNKYNSWLSWLEKQGELFDDNIITRDDEILQAISIGLTDAEKYLDWSDFGGLPIKEIQDWLEKQGNIGNLTDKDMKEALRTEYEKGRADAFAEMQKEWSEEDECTLNGILDDYKSMCKTYRNWLESLKNRIQPQQKQEWRKNEKQMFADIITIVGKSKAYIREYQRELVDFLKFLKERYTWKPSDEQMNAFEQVYDWYNNNFAPSETLTSLYKDLEKLKGE